MVDGAGCTRWTLRVEARVSSDVGEPDERKRETREIKKGGCGGCGASIKGRGTCDMYEREGLGRPFRSPSVDIGALTLSEAQ